MKTFKSRHPQTLQMPDRPSGKGSNWKTKTVLILLDLITMASLAQAQGTAFTYQGELMITNSPASGAYDLRFTLFGTNSGGSAIAGPITNSPVVITDQGRFTVALDFGNAFDGSPRWLELAVRTNGGGDFAILSPRQPVAPAPYALNATMLANSVALGSGVNNYITLDGTPASFIGGGSSNMVFSPFSVISGGSGNMIGEEVIGAVIGGGSGNINNASSGVVAGGYHNQTSGLCSTVSGGEYNRANGTEATVGGGSFNRAIAQDATVAGGYTNLAGKDYATVGGGLNNQATGVSATVPGGSGNLASGTYSFACGAFNLAAGIGSFAAGMGASASDDYSFVWSDDEGATSDLPGQFKIQAKHGVVMDVSGSAGVNPAALFINSTSSNGVGLYVVQSRSSDAAVVINTDSELLSGVGDLIKGFGWSPRVGFGQPNSLVFRVTAYGEVSGLSFNSTSDRNTKENFQDISPAEILQKVAALPVTQWKFKGDRQNARHIGPMAQDFHAAFGLNGPDDKRISLTDEGGVALAAIQGLNEKVESGKTELAELRAENTALRQALRELSQTVQELKHQMYGGAQ